MNLAVVQCSVKLLKSATLNFESIELQREDFFKS